MSQSRQRVEIFSQNHDSRGRGEFDAGEVLAKWVQENRDVRVVSIAGDGSKIIAVVEPAEDRTCRASGCACPFAPQA